MKTENCPKCGGSISKVSINRQAKTRVGNCPKCRKLVTLGKIEENNSTGAAGNETRPPREAQKKVKARVHKATAHTNPDQRSSDPVRAERSGFVRGLAKFFDA